MSKVEGALTVTYTRLFQYGKLYREMIGVTDGVKGQ